MLLFIKGKNEITLGGLGVSFACTNAVFTGCLFSDDTEALMAKAVFETHKS
jgi:hypothetical protein